MATMGQRRRGFGDVIDAHCDFFRRCAVGQNPTAQYPIAQSNNVGVPTSDCKCYDEPDFWLWVALGLAAYLVMKGK